MKVCLVRHGETDWSLAGRHTGISNIGLTANGKTEAAGLATGLSALSFGQVLVSPRLRARQTCELAGFGAVSAIESDLCEWDYGQYEGLRSEDIRRDRPDWDIWLQGCPDGERPADISARADRLIARIGALPGAVLLFSHGQFGAAFAMRWIGLPVAAGRHLALESASVALLGTHPHHPGQRAIIAWNRVFSAHDPAKPPHSAVVKP